MISLGKLGKGESYQSLIFRKLSKKYQERNMRNMISNISGGVYGTYQDENDYRKHVECRVPNQWVPCQHHNLKVNHYII